MNNHSYFTQKILTCETYKYQNEHYLCFDSKVFIDQLLCAR